MDELTFSKPKLWYFSGHVPHMVLPSGVNRLSAPQRQQRPKTVGIVALSFDRAYTKLKECAPELRISGVAMHDQNIDLIVDDPVAHAVAAKLAGVE